MVMTMLPVLKDLVMMKRLLGMATMVTSCLKAVVRRIVLLCVLCSLRQKR